MATGEQESIAAQPAYGGRGLGPLTLPLAALAGLTWAGALALLFVGGVDQIRDPLAPLRLFYCGLALAAGLLTFVPIQVGMRLPGLAREGALGTLLLLYTLAYVPPPRDWLLALPDAPVYLIFGAALFWFVSAAAFPVVFAIGRRVFRERARQYDLRRARRQSHEVGAVVVGWLLLSGLRVMTLLGILLVVLIAIVAELLFLSFVEAET